MCTTAWPPVLVSDADVSQTKNESLDDYEPRLSHPGSENESVWNSNSDDISLTHLKYDDTHSALMQNQYAKTRKRSEEKRKII